MATASRHLCRHLLRISTRPTTKRRCQTTHRQRIQPSPFPRQLSTSSFRLAATANSTEKTESSQIDFKDSELQIPEQPYTPSDLDPQERAHYETLSKPDQIRYLALQNHFKAIMEGEEMAAITESESKRVAEEIHRSGKNPNLIEERNIQALRDGFWQEEEDDEFGVVPDDDDEVSDDLITSVAESELEVHREVREYTRIAAWDLPLLLQFTKPFELPDMKQMPLRFRYTTFMGEPHPSSKKVVLEFTTREIAAASSLTEAQRIKLIKLVGVRYNPDKDLVKMSCEQFENAAQNKRYLGDLVGKIITEAKDTTDTFDDIPLDFRHHKPKKTHIFPESWKVGSQEGVKRLAQGREELRLLGEGQQTVDGKELVELYVRSKTVQPSFARPM